MRRGGVRRKPKRDDLSAREVKGGTTTRPHGQAVKTSPFHGGIMGSNPVGVTRQVKGEPVSIRRRIRLYHKTTILNTKEKVEICLIILEKRLKL